MSVVFDRAASFYDRTRGIPEQAARALADAVRANTGLQPGSRALEIGVGTGRIALPLSRLGYRYIGVDLSAEMMRALRAKPGQQQIELARADAASLPFGEQVFDAVIAVHVFHLIGDWPAAMDEARRVLRPGGVLLHGSNQHAEGNGPWELRRKIGELSGTAGERHDRGLAGWDEIAPQLRARFGEPRQFDTPPWTLSTTPHEVLDQLRERIWSHTWSMDDAEIERASQLAADWAIERWGSLDVPLLYQQRFRWDVYTNAES